MPIAIDVAELVGIIIEGCLYGIFLVLFGTTLYTLLWKRKFVKLNITMVIAVCLMAALATSQLIVDTLNIFRAFIPLDRQSRIIFLSDPSEPIYAAKHAIYLTMIHVGDAIAIYRAYIVWNRRLLVIVLPVFCTFGSAISAYQTIWALRHIENASMKAETGLAITVLSLSLAANTMATFAVAFKIWKNEQQFNSAFPDGSRNSVMPVARIVAESGLVNAAYLLVYTVVLVNGTHALEVMSNIATPLVGILFTAVIIRATIMAEKDGTSSRTTRSNTFALNSSNSMSKFPRNGVEVNVEWANDSSTYKGNNSKV